MNTETPTSPFDTYPCDKDGPCPQHLQQASFNAESPKDDTAAFLAAGLHARTAAKNADWVAAPRSTHH